jgi:enoyl-CoA hydratase/carnithine racemase
MEHLIFSTHKAVLSIQFNRANKKNAITPEMYQGLTQALEECQSNDDIHVVVLKGHTDCFTAGSDLNGFSTMDEHELQTIKSFLNVLAAFPKPVVAAVAGPCVGIGVTLLMHCDIVIAADNAFFKLPFIDLALCPEFASSLLLPKAMGYHKAAEHLMLGTSFNAEQAYQYRMVNYVVDKGTLFSMADEIATELSLKPQQALLHTKALLKYPLFPKISEQIQEELAHFEACLETEEAQGRIRKMVG